MATTGRRPPKDRSKAKTYVETVKAIRENIRALRMRRGLTQAQLGEAVGTGQNWIYAIETGATPDGRHGKIPLDMLCALAEALSQPVHLFLIPGAFAEHPRAGK